VEEDDVVGAVMGLEADAVRADGLPLSQFFPNCFLRSLKYSQLFNYDFVIFLWQIALFVLLSPFLPSDYSPISILPVLSKIMEKFLFDQSIGHLNFNDLSRSIRQYIS
jgi:hypothetical protein